MKNVNINVTLAASLFTEIRHIALDIIINNKNKKNKLILSG